MGQRLVGIKKWLLWTRDVKVKWVHLMVICGTSTSIYGPRLWYWRSILDIEEVVLALPVDISIAHYLVCCYSCAVSACAVFNLIRSMSFQWFMLSFPFCFWAWRRHKALALAALALALADQDQPWQKAYSYSTFTSGLQLPLVSGTLWHDALSSKLYESVLVLILTSHRHSAARKYLYLCLNVSLWERWRQTHPSVRARTKTDSLLRAISYELIKIKPFAKTWVQRYCTIRPRTRIRI